MIREEPSDHQNCCTYPQHQCHRHGDLLTVRHPGSPWVQSAATAAGADATAYDRRPPLSSSSLQQTGSLRANGLTRVQMGYSDRPLDEADPALQIGDGSAVAQCSASATSPVINARWG